LPITNLSDIVPRLRVDVRFLSPITNHFSPLTAALAASRCVDLGLLSITAAFRSARDFEKIPGGGFEDIGIRISQCDVTGLIRQTNREPGASYPAAFMIFFSS
jgi:hypothetical protein